MDGKDEQGLLEYLLLTGCIFVKPRSETKYQEFVHRVKDLPLPEDPERLKRVQTMLKAANNGRSCS